MLSVDFDVRDAGVFPLTRQENCAIIESIRGEQDMDSEESTAEELEAKRRVYAHLAQGAADVKAGRVQPLDDAIDEIIRELETCS